MDDFSNRLQKALDTKRSAPPPSRTPVPMSRRSGPDSDQIREYEEHQRLLDISVPSMLSEIACQINARSVMHGKYTNARRIYTDYDKPVWRDTGDGGTQEYEKVTINGYYIAYGYGKRKLLSRKYPSYWILYVGYTNGALQCEKQYVSIEDLREAVLEVASSIQLYPKELSEIPDILINLVSRHS